MWTSLFYTTSSCYRKTFYELYKTAMYFVYPLNKLNLKRRDLYLSSYITCIYLVVIVQSNLTTK